MPRRNMTPPPARRHRRAPPAPARPARQLKRSRHRRWTGQQPALTLGLTCGRKQRPVGFPGHARLPCSRARQPGRHDGPPLPRPAARRRPPGCRPPPRAVPGLFDVHAAAPVPGPSGGGRPRSRHLAHGIRAFRRGPVPGGAFEQMTSQTAQDATTTTQPPRAPQQQEMPLAVVHGQPLLQIPQDLYIPPDALEVILDAFEGPLDLLLYLIRRQNLDILDIPVAEITRQYVDYIQAMHEMRFELAAEYLVMAAILAEIKSRMLLPRSELAEDEEGDPRAELVRRLQEYERFKQAAEDLDALPRQDRDTTPAGAF